MNSPNARPRPYEEQPPKTEGATRTEPVEFSGHLHASPPLHDTAGEPQYTADAPPLHDHSGADGYAHPDEFDPVWTGEGEVTERSGAVTQADLDRIEEILSSEHFRIRRERAGRSERKERREFVPPPPPPAPKAKGNAVAWAAGTFVVLVAASAFLAYQMTERVPLLDTASDTGGVMSRVASMLGTPKPEQAEAPAPAPQPASVEAPSPAPAPKPHLVVNGASADSTDQILVGVSAEGVSDGMTAVIGGLVPGTTLSAGKPWGSTGWIVPAAELGTTHLRPPAGFAGTMEYTVSLHRADNSVVDRQTMRLEWMPQRAGTPARSEEPARAELPSPPAAKQQADARQLTPEEVADLLKRGEELLMQGDIASARLVLQRAADAQAARAALTLATTYDPIEMKRLGVYGAAPDVTKARDWYEKAKLYGSREAPRRLEMLASQYR